jgi:hypothetical protein
VVVEWVAERVVRGESIRLGFGMAVLVWELNKVWVAYMTLTHDCPTIFLHLPAQRHPLKRHGRERNRRQKDDISSHPWYFTHNFFPFSVWTWFRHRCYL